MSQHTATDMLRPSFSMSFACVLCLQGNTVDWTISNKATIRNPFLAHVNRRYGSNTTPYWKLAAVQKRAAVAAADGGDVIAASEALASSAAAVTPSFAMNQYTMELRPRAGP
jgi:hypothetical protein